MLQVEIQDTINLISNYDDTLLKEDEILMLLNIHVRRSAIQKSISEKDVLQMFQENLESFRKRWTSILINIQLEQERYRESGTPTHLTEYRYSVAGIVKIYREIAHRKISTKTINDHMAPDLQGFAKLNKVTVPHEYNTVLESNLIEYFYYETGIRISPERIRKHSYRPPVKLIVDKDK